MASHRTRKHRYKQLLDEGKEIDEAGDELEVIDKISAIVLNANKIKSESELSDQNFTTELVMDSQILKMSYESVGHVMEKVGSSTFSEEEFINAIKTLVHRENTEDWSAISEIAAGITTMTKFSCCLFGSFEHELVVTEKSQKERQKRAKVVREELKKPESVIKLEKEDSDLKRVDVVLQQIKQLYRERKNTPIPFYKLITDPENFMYTVDNAFQVAFLVRDGRIAVDADEDDIVTVRPVPKGDTSATEDRTVQAIASLNMILWEKMVNKYNITRPMLKMNRESDISPNKSQQNGPAPSTSRSKRNR